MATVKGGDKYAKVLEDIAQRLSNPPTLRVGFLESATYPDGTQVALVAAVNEFGTLHAGAGRNVVIPPRPFFRSMVAKHKKEWPQAIAMNLKATKFDVDKTLRRVGEGIKGQLQQSIIETNSPPNAPSTIAKKGSDHPLIDTAHMLQSVDYDVK